MFMISKKLLKYFESNKIKYEVVNHKMVYTAYDLAATMKIKMNQIAKSLLIKFNKPFIQGEKPYAIAIVPADKNIDLRKLAKIVSDWAVKLNKELRLKPLLVNAKKGKNSKPIVDIYQKVVKVELPKEKVMKDKFKVKPGAMAAFGRIYKLPVFADKGLKGVMLFSSGSFTDSIKMAVGDFNKMEGAMAGKFGKTKKSG